MDTTSIVLKRDGLGRVRTPVERREALVAEFQCSGLSAARFAQLAGVRYNTFWTWLKKHGAGVKPSRNRFLRSGSARGYAPSLHLHYRTCFASQASCISTKPNENHPTIRGDGFNESADIPRT